MDTIPDRDLLRDRATRRLRLISWSYTALGIVAAVALLTGIVIGSGRFRLILIVPFLVIVGVGLAITAAFRRSIRDPALFQGADRTTQRAIARALKHGGSDDPRIDALARDLTRHNLEHVAAPWIFTAGVVLMAIGLITTILGGEFGMLRIVQLIGFLAFLIALISIWQTRIRSRRYPGGQP